MGDRAPQAVVVGAPDDVGTLVITDEVLVEIARTEAMATEGVVQPLEHGMQGVFRRRAPQDIRLERSEQEVAFNVTLGVRGGMRIPEVATKVRQRVAAAVCEKTGYVVRSVNLRVDHVVFGEGPSEGS